MNITILGNLTESNIVVLCCMFVSIQGNVVITSSDTTRYRF